MAAACDVKGDEPSESRPDSQNDALLKTEDKSAQSLSLNEVHNSMDGDHRDTKTDQASKKFVDAPAPVTNVWTRRSASLTSAVETSQSNASAETKRETASERSFVQGNTTVQRSTRAGKGSVSDPEGTKPEKLQSEKLKVDVNGNRQTGEITSTKPRIKKFGEDYVEAPLPTVNPWKRPSTMGVVATSAVSLRAEFDPTPASAAMSSNKDVQPNGQVSTADPRKESKLQNRNSLDDQAAINVNSPALEDENWPTLDEVKVTEPMQTMPPKATKSPKVKLVQTTLTTPELSPAPDSNMKDSVQSIQEDNVLVNKLIDVTLAQTHLQNDSGGDDSSKENKDNVLSDDTNNAVKNKKGTKPKWQRMEIDHPKPERRNRRSRSQGRGNSPSRREGRQAGDRFQRPNNKRSDGPDSQNWRANMISQTSNASPQNIDNQITGGTGVSFGGSRVFRGRGGNRGTALRRGGVGGGRGRGGTRETKSPVFQSNENTWNHEQPFPCVTPTETDSIPVPWSPGYNRVQTIPRVPPINTAVVLGLETNLYIQEQLLNILGQSSMYYETDVKTYAVAPEILKHQVEYYFSEDNLVKDLFLRKKMDKQGWVKLELVLSFNKVKELKADYHSLIQAIRSSDKLQLSEHEDFVRTLNTPDVWPIEEDFKGLPPPPAVQMVAAMSTLHSDAPEFVPGQPFILRNLTSDTPQFVPDPNTDVTETVADVDEESLMTETNSNMTNMLSSR